MSDTNIKTEKHQFRAEVKQLLDILVHSLYTSREIFLRESISNASDALDKVRFEMRRGTEVIDKDLPLEIKITIDEKEKLLTISDSGIGMSKDEIIENIGTIAKSGTADFIKRVAEDKSEINNIIGKFGVGFYSVFMVAEKVVVRTKSYIENEDPYEWSSQGVGDYELTKIEEKIPRGTTINIFLKEDAKEFTEKYRLESIIKKHSNFIFFPILIDTEKINTVTAIWREPKSSITTEQYTEFYKFLSYDNEEPMYTIHNTVDAPIQFNCLLFIPKKNFDFFGFNRENFGLDLYVRRVLIQHKNKDLLPEYLSFVKGVVDSEDLPLNISRETLQENLVFSKIAESIKKNLYSFLQQKTVEEPENYLEFWKAHGKIFKLGYGDYTYQEKFTPLLRFNSSFNLNAEELIALDDYVRRMKQDQKEIYYIMGNSRQAIELDPHLEIFKKKGIEVVYLYDPIDEFIISSIRKYKEFDFKSVDTIDLGNLDKFNDETAKESNFEKLNNDDELHFNSLLARMKEILGDKVTEVKESKRLVGSACCLVNPDDAMASSMKKILRMTGKDNTVQKKVLEVNKDNKLIRNLLTVFKTNSRDEYIVNVVEQIFDAALLMEGTLMDPHNLVSRINQILEQSSDWYLSSRK